MRRQAVKPWPHATAQPDGLIGLFRARQDEGTGFWRPELSGKAPIIHPDFNSRGSDQ
jgi:hypothetical protein